MLASQDGHNNIVELLLLHNVNIDLQNIDGCTDFKETTMLAFLRHNASADFHNRAGHTPLTVAAANGYVEALRLILDRNSPVNAQDRKGRTALISSVLNNKIQCAELLLDYEARADIQDHEGKTALTLASQKFPVLLELLVPKGGHNAIDMQDNTGQTPLMISAENGDINSTQLLLRHRANTNLQDKMGRTACMRVMYSMGAKHYLPIADCDIWRDITNMLVNNGASANISDKSGTSPLMICAGRGWCGLTDMLLRHQADVNASDKDGITALQLAVEHGHVDVTECLLNHGASVSVLKADGSTLLMTSVKPSQHSLIELLLRHNVPLNS